MTALQLFGCGLPENTTEEEDLSFEVIFLTPIRRWRHDIRQQTHPRVDASGNGGGLINTLRICFDVLFRHG